MKKSEHNHQVLALKVEIKNNLLPAVTIFRGPDKEGYSALFPTISPLLFQETLCCGYSKESSHLLSTHNIELQGQIRISEHAKRPLSRALYHVTERLVKQH